MTEASRVQKMLNEQNVWIDKLKSQVMRLELDVVGYRTRNKQLESALHQWDDLIVQQFTGSRAAMSAMTEAAQITAALLHGDAPWHEPRIEKLEAALRFYACDCKPDCGCGIEYYDGGAYCGRTAQKALEVKDDVD